MRKRGKHPQYHARRALDPASAAALRRIVLDHGPTRALSLLRLSRTGLDLLTGEGGAASPLMVGRVTERIAKLRERGIGT